MLHGSRGIAKLQSLLPHLYCREGVNVVESASKGSLNILTMLISLTPLLPQDAIIILHPWTSKITADVGGSPGVSI